MSNLFGSSNDPRMQRQIWTSRYNAARSNILFMVIFSAFNLLMLATNSGAYFLFSAAVPYIITDTGMFFCGMYPKEFYTGEFEGMVFADKSLFVISLVASILILGIYLLCWFLSKKKGNALVVALVLFGIDTLVMLWNYGLTDFIDLGFHIWLVVILAMGVSAHSKMKKLPVEERPIEAEFTELPVDGDGEGNTDGEAIGAPKKERPDSVALRPADNTVKSRVLLEYEIYGHKITYRRVKRINELVIDGDVYSEYIALAEMPHMLAATVDGHYFAAGTDNTSHAYIKVDGQTAIQKLRIV